MRDGLWWAGVGRLWVGYFLGVTRNPVKFMCWEKVLYFVLDGAGYNYYILLEQFLSSIDAENMHYTIWGFANGFKILKLK